MDTPIPVKLTKFEEQYIEADKYFGDVIVDDVFWFEDTETREQILPDESLAKIDAAVATRKYEVLKKLPFDQIINSLEVSKILKISSSAAHKSVMVRTRTFNFIDPRDNNRKFDKKSVELLHEARQRGDKRPHGFYDLKRKPETVDIASSSNKIIIKTTANSLTTERHWRFDSPGEVLPVHAEVSKVLDWSNSKEEAAHA